MKFIFICTITALSLTRVGFTTESAQGEERKQEIIKISEAFGHLMGKNLESIGVQFDIQYVIKGLQDAAEGKTSPMTEMECIQAITAAQETVYKEQATKNLASAEDFLQKNKEAEGVISLEEGKVQYKIEQEGTGEPLSESSTPLIRYTGKFLDGTVFGSSKEDEPLCLEEVISGLKSGLIGMKEGEKRTIFIHPDCAYGTQGSLPPNALLTFEIEIVKAQAPITAESDGDLASPGEIALPEETLLEEEVR